VEFSFCLFWGFASVEKPNFQSHPRGKGGHSHINKATTIILISIMAALASEHICHPADENFI
jgi:hypothetical protein